MIDSSKRKLFKAVSWKSMGFVILSVLTFMATGDLRTVGIIGVVYHLLMIVLYFLHENAWERVSWGKTSGLFVQMTGMSGAGKTTLARLVQQRLRKKGIQVEVIDGDEYRSGLCSDLGFSKEDRNTNIRRLGFVSKVLARNNVVSIISAINPYEEVRKELCELADNVKVVYVKCDLETLKERDTKGLYRKALLPDDDPEKIHNFTGISDPFEEPSNPNLRITTNNEDIESSARKLEDFILKSIC
jgi:adenylylsulfate kinase